MKRELLFSSVVGAVWLAICFLSFGALYIGVGFLLDPTGLMQFEPAWGVIQISPRVSIPRLSIFVFAAAMFLACVPINLYWLKRLNREMNGREDFPT